MGWKKLSLKKPKKVGNYLCITNDNLYMVCHVAANGWWSKVPDAAFYGDLGKCVLNSKTIDREVIFWRKIKPLHKRNKKLEKTLLNLLKS